MTLDGFIELIQRIDSKAERYDAIGEPGEKYTVYSDYMVSTLRADDCAAEKILHVQVEYFTDEEDDPVAQQYLKTFSETASVYFTYDKDFDPRSRTIRHLFDCEVA